MYNYRGQGWGRDDIALQMNGNGFSMISNKGLNKGAINTVIRDVVSSSFRWHQTQLMNTQLGKCLFAVTLTIEITLRLVKCNNVSIRDEPNYHPGAESSNHAPVDRNSSNHIGNQLCVYIDQHDHHIREHTIQIAARSTNRTTITYLFMIGVSMKACIVM